ncbi:SRPBCC family protein [Myxococcus sp. K15C18031901]|uniref:SRPBCC family protein n=1 Tax=Myxococcus dinghuensis TaxID=2906761 RepID=UPI0020A7B4FE|nr:SRPBCC family protein [Myxococcus dinghuensis]MCP3104957.1 SRPBCC family protein [Myxococcus dinghuensis]
MTAAFYLLLVIGALGAFDVVYFHGLRGRLMERPECQREVLWHTARHLIYALQFLWVANLRPQGLALLPLVLLYAADVFVAFADVWEERRSRASLGGVFPGEYLMHVALSVLVGLYLMATFHAVWPDRLLPTGVRAEAPAVPVVLRALMSLMGLGALVAFVRDLTRWRAFRRGGAHPASRAPVPRRIVVEALIPAPVGCVWERTQDPDLHTAWDVRFTSIRYLPECDARGYHEMDYRTRLGFGLEVAGWGRYLANTPLERSTFEFGSDDPLSLILRGRGVWLYERRPGGTFFKTVFDYQTRHGALGALLDDLLFRPVMRLGTEWGFETLRRWCAGDVSAPERRRARWRFACFLVARTLGMAPRPGAARSWLGSGARDVTPSRPCGELVGVSS